MATRRATHLRAVRAPEAAETPQAPADHSQDTQTGEAAQDAASVSSAPQAATQTVPPQYNEHDAKVAMARVNELLAAIQRQGAVIPPQALAGLQAQAQALAALRLLVNYLGIPEPVAQVAESQAMHQLLGAVLVEVEAQAAARGKPQIVVPGRH